MTVIGKPNRLHIQLVDPTERGGKQRQSRALTVYNVTLNEAYDRIREMFSSRLKVS